MGQRDQRRGLFDSREQRLNAPGDVTGLDVIELGCGTAFLSAGLCRMGARPVGVDITPAQLDSARRCQDHFGLHFPAPRGKRRRRPAPSQLLRSCCQRVRGLRGV